MVATALEEVQVQENVVVLGGRSEELLRRGCGGVV